MLYTGVDMVEVARIAQAIKRWGTRFERRVWTSAELHHCAGKIESLAARWAAKEAAAKALGVGLRGLGVASAGVAWTEIEVGHELNGRPVLLLHGSAAIQAQTMGVTAWSLSLSHTDTLTIAFVVGH